MFHILNAMNNYFEKVPDHLRKIKWLVWIFFIAVTVFLSFGLTRIEFDMTLEGWFNEDDPTKKALDEFRAEFGSDDGIYIVYRPKDGNVFSEKSLKAVQGIREDILNFRTRLKPDQVSKLNHIQRVNSLVNAPVLSVDSDALVSRRLVGQHIPSDPKELLGIQKLAESQKNFPLLYFSKDRKFGGLFIETDFGAISMDATSPAQASSDRGRDAELTFEDDFQTDFEIDDSPMEADEQWTKKEARFQSADMDDYLGLMKDINDIIYNPEYATHLEYYLVGNAPLTEFSMEIMAEMGPMYSVMLGIMIFLLWLLFRSFCAVIWPLLIVILSTVWTVGITGWMGATITTMLMLTVMLILAVGTADAIHILSGYMYFRKKGVDHNRALRSAFRKSALACMLTSLTTMIGMLALTLTPISHIATFGYMSALGVGLAFVFTVFLLPAMLDLWSPVAKKNKAPKAIMRKFGHFVPNISNILQKILAQILPIVQKSPVGFASIFLALFGLCLFGAFHMKVDSNIVEQFKEGTSIRDTYEIVDANMMGTQSLEILLDMGKENAFNDPDVLKAMDSLQDMIAGNYGNLVVRTFSLVDVVKDAYQTLNEGREEMCKIPDQQDVLAQTLFMFNNANPTDRRKVVSDDYQKSHITVQLHNAGSHEYIQVFDQIRQDIDTVMTGLKSKYPDLKVSVTGGLALMMELSDYITWSQLKSLILVIFVISIILVFVFGSYRAGLISIIPNLVPATLTFGLLGLFDLPLDMDTMVIAPVIIGIAVDDTIHFITHYRSEVLLDGNVINALQETIKEVGQAITFTTLILGFGFGVMAFSNHMGTSIMGKFGTLAIFAALLCDLLFLPAMILIFKPKFQKITDYQENIATIPVLAKEGS